MRFFAAGYTGTGADLDPFRPEGVDALEGWAANDFRPDSTRADGFCLVAVPDGVDLPGALLIADAAQAAFGPVARRAVGNRLGLTVTASRFDDLLVELFTAHASPVGDRSRWNPPTRTVEGRFQLVLGEPIVDQLWVSGGATYTEDFDKADSSTLGPDLTWTEMAGDLEIVDNVATNATRFSGNAHRARAEHDMASSNNYAKYTAENSSGGGTGDEVWSAHARYQSGADTNYFARIERPSNTWSVRKMEAGSVTSLTSGSGSDPRFVTHGIECRANGSTIAAYRAGVLVLSVTDTAIATGTRGGLSMASVSTVRAPAANNFEMGDLAAAATPRIPRARSLVPLHHAAGW